MGDIKQDVKESVKVFTRTFVSYVVKESTKKLIKRLTQMQRKMLETRVKNMSDDQLEEYFDNNPYFKKELENTVKSANHIQQAKEGGSWLENLQMVCESSCIRNLIKALIEQVTRTVLAVVAGTVLLAVIAVPMVMINDESGNDTQFPVANFSSNATAGPVPLSVQFNDSSKNATKWIWDFGDGNSSKEQNPSHTYSVAGNYTIFLTATNKNGTNSTFAMIFVQEPPVPPVKPILPFANFISSTTRGYVPLSVQFTDQSENASGWDWDFGDGVYSTDQNPTHRYSTVGNYSVNLTASNENGTDSTFAIIEVLKKPVEGETILPFANFTSNVTKGYVPLSVQFTDQSENATMWKWDFGDGTSSTKQDPMHTYFAAGNYTINLTATNANGTDSMSAIIAVLEQPAPPDANFTSNVTSGPKPLTVSFTDRSTGNPAVWNWDFGDGATSVVQNPVHTYNSAHLIPLPVENYYVKLTVSNAKGTSSKTDLITILPSDASIPPVLPVANFSGNVTQGYAPLSVQFTDQSENATGWSWDFGDENTSVEQSPVHTYSKTGNYTVKLTVSNAEGMNSTSAIIEVLKIPDPFPIQITKSGSAYKPAIYGDRIVWNDFRNGYQDTDIYMYNISTRQEAQITTSGFVENPAIYGDRIVCEDDRNGNSDIYMYDLSSFKETQITANGSPQYNPVIYGEKIVWNDFRIEDVNTTSDIYVYDLSTSMETRITTSGSAEDPAIHGDRIVWSDYRNGNYDIYMYDLSTSTETQITTNESDQYSPDIHGDRIVWNDDRNGNYNIYMYDLSTSMETQITTDESYKSGPAIYGNRIVWNEKRNGNFDIYMYDLSTSTETQITSYESVQYTATAIYGDRIVWVSEEEGGDIYLYDLSIRK